MKEKINFKKLTSSNVFATTDLRIKLLVIYRTRKLVSFFYEKEAIQGIGGTVCPI